MSCSRPGKRQIREHGQAKDRPQLRLIRVREQSVVASSPCQQARQQTVRSSDINADSTACNAAAATDGNDPQTGRNPELSRSTASFLTNIGCEPEQAENCAGGRIVVAISTPNRFPVQIRRIPTYDRV
jgi:hypothetical protein